MADLKKRVLSFSNGKQVKLYGNSIAISKSLELGEGYAPNIFSFSAGQVTEKVSPSVSNPHGLSKDEILELADYNIRLWMDLKDSIRKHGINNVKVFNKEAILP